MQESMSLKYEPASVPQGIPRYWATFAGLFELLLDISAEEGGVEVYHQPFFFITRKPRVE